jgi:hypothetical protein
MPLQAMRVLFAVCLAALVALGCASYGGRGLVPGQSTVADVEALMGAPAESRPGPNNELWLYYPRQPFGRAVFVARLAADERLIGVEQRLTQENFARVLPNVTGREEVRDLFGPPWQVMNVARMQREIWTWRIRRFGEVGAPMSMHVQISPDGLVREVYFMDDDPPPFFPGLMLGMHR